ncbi:MAG: InlB B-repeat-containing protein [Lachnospiraceae bacterium]|nr:InlB B-repeat-containing protein [Lachnospiraceae bacterium]
MLARKAKRKKLAKMLLTAMVAVGIVLLGMGMESRAEGDDSGTEEQTEGTEVVTTSDSDSSFSITWNTGSGPSSTNSYAADGVVSFATVDWEGYLFIHWSYNGVGYTAGYGEGSKTFTDIFGNLSSSITLQAVFAKSVTFTSDTGEVGTATVSMDSNGNVTVSYTFTPKSTTYSLAKWAINGVEFNSGDSIVLNYVQSSENSHIYVPATDNTYGVTASTTNINITTYWELPDSQQLLCVQNNTGVNQTIGGKTIESGQSGWVVVDSSDYPTQTAENYGFFSANGEAVSLGALITDADKTQYTTEYDSSCRVQYNTVELTSDNTCQYGTFSYNENKPGETSETSSSLIPLSSASSALSLPTPTASGYVFKGWATSADATTVEYSAGAQVTLNDLKAGDSYSTLYGVWKKLYSFSYEGGSTTESVAEGDSVTVPAAPTLNGFTFAGWEYSSTLYEPEVTFTMPAENVSLAATWQIAYTKISEAGRYYLVNGYSYILDKSLTVDGDSSVYESGISFYVNAENDYVFN